MFISKEMKVGYYVNPTDRSKEVFLIDHGIVVPGRTLNWSDVPEGNLPVVLVNNGHFTSACIAYDERELAEATDREDDRPRTIYIVPVEKLLTVGGDDFRQWHERQLANACDWHGNDDPLNEVPDRFMHLPPKE